MSFREPKPLVARDLEATGPPDRTYKVVFAGDAAVGKTSFINRITKGIFLNNLSSTLGVDFQVKMLRVDERNIALQLWDTAGIWIMIEIWFMYSSLVFMTFFPGQERFRSVTRSYFRRADGVMLLYDVTNEKSFLSVRQWIDAVDVITYYFFKQISFFFLPAIFHLVEYHHEVINEVEILHSCKSRRKLSIGYWKYFFSIIFQKKAHKFTWWRRFLGSTELKHIFPITQVDQSFV